MGGGGSGLNPGLMQDKLDFFGGNEVAEWSSSASSKNTNSRLVVDRVERFLEGVSFPST